MPDFHLNLLGKPFFLFPQPPVHVPPMPPPQPLPQPLPQPIQQTLPQILPQAVLPQIPQLQPPTAANLWDPFVNPILFQFPPPPVPTTTALGFTPPQQNFESLLNFFNSQNPLIGPMNPLFAHPLHAALLPPPPPPAPPVPLMSLRIATPPAYRAHPYRAESIGVESKENKNKRMKRASEGRKSRFDDIGRNAVENTATRAISHQVAAVPQQFFIPTVNSYRFPQ